MIEYRRELSRGNGSRQSRNECIKLQVTGKCIRKFRNTYRNFIELQQLKRQHRHLSAYKNEVDGVAPTSKCMYSGRLIGIDYGNQCNRQLFIVYPVLTIALFPGSSPAFVANAQKNNTLAHNSTLWHSYTFTPKIQLLPSNIYLPDNNC